MINSEFRQDPVTGIWVIISEGRRSRPDELTQSNGRKQLPSYNPDCFFCPGNEDKTPPEILAYRNGRIWWARTIPNKFPALSLEARVEGGPELTREGMFVKKPGYGMHEVIIETPSHNQDIHSRPLDQIREMLWMYRDRLMAYKNDKGLENVLIFKNKGDSGGASLEHPHSQLTASPMHMQMLDLEIQGAERYFLSKNFMGKKGQCVYCDMTDQELENANRVIAENPSFVAFLPFASRFPFEAWILPKTHKSDYASISPEEATYLAMMVKDIFHRLHRTLRDPDYNMILHTTPLNSGIQEYYHWHIEVIPRLTKIAGFELGAGNNINIVAPERAAQFINTN